VCLEYLLSYSNAPNSRGIAILGGVCLLCIKIPDISGNHFEDECFFFTREYGYFFELVNEFGVGEGFFGFAVGVAHYQEINDCSENIGQFFQYACRRVYFLIS